MSEGQPTFEVEFTLSELRLVSKSLGITLDVLSRKMERLDPNSRVGGEMRADYLGTSSALAEVRACLDEAVTGVDDG
jgi:hypothetical protein